jgi:hypothetical protein
LGLSSAYYSVRNFGFEKFIVSNGPWTTDLTSGGVDAGMYTRARVAIAGLLALNKSEATYYIATRDSAGDPLDGNCSYRIEGRDPDARWWSITAYANDNFLIDTPSRNYSVSKTSVVRSADGTFVVRLSPAAEQQNWIATSPDGFDVMLRLYNPGTSVVKDPSTTLLPSITREACS